MSGYDRTPSFYSDDDTFEKYLGQTSYYLALQRHVMDIVSHVAPDQILELGSGTGTTTLRLADDFPATEALGIDNRETVIAVSRAKVEERGLSNIAFETADMTEFVTTGSLSEMVVLLYSFHHIPDPLQ